MDKETLKLVKKTEREAKKADKEVKFQEKLARKEERERNKAEKLAEKEKRKEENQRSESDIVKQYATKIINNQGFNGRIKGQENIKKNVWMDTDFYFSVVFQSKEQKETFLAAYTQMLNIAVDLSKEHSIEIINGMKLAKGLGIHLEQEVRKDYPLPDLDLKGFVMDNISY